jgi:preprotein translocase subunit SecF
MRFPFTLVPAGTSIDFVGRRKIAFAFSLLLTALTIVFFFTKGLALGIDFTGGVILELQTSEQVQLADLRHNLETNGYSGATLQGLGDKGIVLIRIQPQQDRDQKHEIDNLKQIFAQSFGEQVKIRKADYVGPKVGKELVANGIWATVAALLAMMAYVAFRFQWQYGIGVLLALAHDMLFTLGFYIVTGIEFDLTSVVAILTVIGYSINDSVVIFDRIRENLRKYHAQELGKLINISINETLSRTVMTLLTTIIACGALVIFGGSTIYGFSLAMLVGIVFGTYSSVYISTPVLLHTGMTKAH